MVPLRRPLLLVLAAACVHAADDGLSITIAESITGNEGQGGDAAELGRIEVLESERIRKARAELPRMPPALVRTIRQDIGRATAELERVLVSRGGTVPIGQMVFHVGGGQIDVEDGPRHLSINVVAGTASSEEDGEVRSWRILPVGDPLKPGDGVAGPAVCGRATLAFTFRADGRDHRALVDPTLPNPYPAWRQEGAEADPLVPELARLPGFPLLVEQVGGRVVLRRVAVEIK